MAELKTRLRTDLNQAMKARQTFQTQALRMALTAITNEEVAGASARELSADEEQKILTREVRKRRESADIYAQANRSELASKETAEADFLATYLPAALTEDELDAIVTSVLAANPDATLKQMGLIIKAVNAQVQGRAPGATVAAKVKAALPPAA
ncbi:MAG: GatB/YqeY domain-containing protein [Propionibacteriaceae bacterium]|jgi:uncharacterized protein YqeY|nr:GatB/YqeY domain-containing protein [Propionibacteriaceae bacterium]